MNPAAIIIINLALLFYSIGVWSERIQGRLKVDVYKRQDRYSPPVTDDVPLYPARPM